MVFKHNTDRIFQDVVVEGTTALTGALSATGDITASGTLTGTTGLATSGTVVATGNITSSSGKLSAAASSDLTGIVNTGTITSTGNISSTAATVTGLSVVGTASLVTGTAPNTVAITPSGGTVYSGTAVRWDDVMVPGLSVKTRGSADPTLTQVGATGLFLYAFPPSSMKEVYFQIQFPHSVKLGGTIEPHIHWMASGTSALVCVWQIDYLWAEVGDNFNVGGGVNTIATSGAGSGTAHDHLVSTFGDLTGKSQVSSCMFGRLYRDGGVGADALTDDAYLVSLDFHCEMDTAGSAEKYTKV